MPTKAAEKALARARQRLEVAKEFRKHEGFDGEDGLWRRLIDLYRGKHFKPGDSDEDRIAVNVCFATINVIGPSIAINRPRVTLTARSAEHHDAAIVAEAAVNYGWEKWNVHPQFQRAVDDYLILGFGWLKIGWAYEETDEPIPDEEWTQQFAEKVQKYEAEALDDPIQAITVPSDEEIARSIPQTRSVVQRDQPYCERVSPFDVYVDPEATSMEDVKWIAQRVIRPLADVRRDKKYKKSAREKVHPDSRLKDAWRPQDRNLMKDGEAARCTVWEFYELKSNTVCVFANGGEDFLVEPQENPMPFAHPFVMLRNYDVPEQFYPMGELEALEPLQHELNKTRSATMNDRKQYRRKYLYRRSAFGRDGVRALTSDKDNELVPVEGTVPFQDAVAPMPTSTLPPEFYQQSEPIEADINHITGLSEYQRGGLPEIRRTATEASIIQDAANARAADKLATVERHMAEVGRKLIQVMQAFQTEDDVARITAKNGQPVWVAYNREEIEGEFEYEIAAGSTQPKNDTARRQQAMQMMQALGPLAVPGGPVNVTELVKYILQFGFGINDVERFINAPNQQPQLGAPTPQDGERPEDAVEREMLTQAGPPGMGPAGPMGDQGLPPELLAGDQNGLSPDPSAAGGGVPPEVLAQLLGQVGLDTAATPAPV